MRTVLACAVVLVAHQAARGQFAIVADERSVMARVEQFFGDYSVVAESTSPPVATASIHRGGNVTAWQSVTTGSSTLAIAGGVRDIDAIVSAVAGNSYTEARGHSDVLIEFDVLSATPARLSVEVDDPATFSYLGDLHLSGVASFVLSGPSGIVIQKPAQADGWADERDVVLEPGRYTVDLAASHAFANAPGADRAALDVGYDFRIEASVVPEPATGLLAVVAIFAVFWLSRRHHSR